VEFFPHQPPDNIFLFLFTSAHIYPRGPVVYGIGLNLMEFSDAHLNKACNAGDLGSIPGSERSTGEENGNSLQFSCLRNPIDRGASGGLQSMGSRKS